MFASRFASLTKQTEVFNRLEALRLEDFWGSNVDDYAGLKERTTRINNLFPCQNPKTEMTKKSTIPHQSSDRNLLGLERPPTHSQRAILSKVQQRVIHLYERIGNVQSRISSNVHQKHGGFRKSLRNISKGKEGSSETSSDTFLMDL